MKKKSLVLLITIFLISTFDSANACTNFLITKGASKDGSTMITYAADSYGMYGELYHWAPAVYPEGAMLKIFEWDTGKYLGEIKQAEETYNVVGNMNQWQVAIGETTFSGRSELENPEGIMDYGSLIYVTLQRARSAREAIKIMNDLVQEYGYYSSGESFSISDPNEVWILEMIGKGEGNKGAVWAAVKIPDGYVSAHANQSRITTFDLNDSENVLYSKDVISFAKEMGYYEGDDAGFSFADAYAPLDWGAIRFCEARVWSFFRRVNKEMDKHIDFIEGKTTERMPLYIKPDKKLSVHDVMHLMRDHYEGTPLDMTKGAGAGQHCSPYRATPLVWSYNDESYFHERPISTPQTAFSFVSQSRSQYPNEVGGIIWFGIDDTYFTVYNPMYTSMTEIPYNYQRGLGSSSEFTWDSAFWVFNFVSNYSYPKYNVVIGDVQTVQNELEGLFVSQQERTDNTALALYKEAPGKAVEYLTKYSNEMAAKTYTSWKKLGENLLLKYMDTITKDEFFKVKRVGYSEDFRKAMAEKDGEYLKMRKAPGQDEFDFADNLRRAEAEINKKNYKKAKELFEAALKIKDDAAVKTKIQQLEEVLNELETLHTKLSAN